jgi:caffeoyl-CoA O-methyltransferase/O-methyltransferase
VFADIARRNVERNGFEGRVSILTGDLLTLVADGSIAAGFDVILLDGGKERYGEFLPICIELLAPRGFIVMDNAFFLGDAVNDEPTTDKGRGVRASLEFARSRDDLELSFVPFSDGILLIRRRDV